MRSIKLAALGVAAVMVFASCGPVGAPPAAKQTIFLSAVEYKGRADAAKEPFPGTTLPGGGGYILKPPGADGRWEAATYRWEPGQIVVFRGDEVTLQIFGVNGAEHPSTIEGYDKSFNVKRGQLTTVIFTADKAGVFRIICQAHLPSMIGQLVVLPRP